MNSVDFNRIELPTKLINTSSGELVSVVSVDGDVVNFVGVNGMGFNKRRDFIYDTKEQ